MGARPGSAEVPAARPVLYVHPSGHLNDLVVPAGALSCLNAVAPPKLGRYAFEVADDDIRAAAVVAIDVHWALALPGCERLVAHVRRLRPEVPIVIGGITAGCFAGELLARYPVDYVVQGDSERPFARLVEALRRGEAPVDLPNVHVRGRPPPRLERMSPADFDATDCVSADWFPTYEKHTNWTAAAFSQGRTIPVLRGCPFKCPECYGSYAQTWGRGYQVRSPERLAALVGWCARRGVRNLRLFVGKPPERTLGRLLAGLARAGPFRFETAVGLFLCTAPSRAELRQLEATFEAPVALSMIPPGEHVPALRPRQLALEEERWRAAADFISRSRTLELDAWSTRTSELGRVRAGLTGGSSERVRVSYGAVWSVTRPVDGRQTPYAVVRDAMAPVWTFYAGRVLSPGLARLLRPWRFLDELGADADSVECPEDGLRGFHAVATRSWRQHRLPTLPGLRFSVVPLRGTLGGPARAPHGVVLGGALRYLEPARLATLERGAPVALAEHADHRGITLACELGLDAGVAALAFVPHPLPDGAVDGAWVGAIGAGGLVALIPGEAASGPARLEVTVRVQAVQAALLDAEGALLAEGRGDLGYYRPDEPSPA